MNYLEKTLGRGEQVILSTRRHYIVLLSYGFKWLLGLIVALAVAIWLAVGVKFNGQLNGSLDTVKTIVVLALYAFALLAFVNLIFNYMRWYNDDYIITNRRVIRISGILNKDELDSSLNMVNDIDVHQSLWGRIFKYGTIEILTAAEDGDNTLSYMPNPIQFRKTLLDAKSGYYNQAGSDAPGIYATGNTPAVPTSYPPSGRVMGGYPAEQVDYNDGGYAAQNSQPRVNTYRPMPTDDYQPSMGTPPTQPLNRANPNPTIQPHDIPALLQQLGKLRDAGIITEAEFQAKKADLLGRL